MGLQCEFRINIFSYTHLVHLEIQPIQERVIHEDMYNLIYKSNLMFSYKGSTKQIQYYFKRIKVKK